MPFLVENKVILYAETPKGGELAWKAAMAYLDWRNENPERVATPRSPFGYRFGAEDCDCASGKCDCISFAIWESSIGTVTVRQSASDDSSWLWRGES